jgi:CubicO group peptidase (beta-lactamase class C family)
MTESASEGLAQFDPLVTEVMREWQVPGLAMAVLRRGEPPRLRCRGVCDVETGRPVGADTVFPICSVTKSFTATMLAFAISTVRICCYWRGGLSLPNEARFSLTPPSPRGP